MASIPGRPYNVGFFFRIIAAPPGNSLTVTVTEYNYNTDTAALDSQTPLLTAATLAKGSYLEFNAGHGKDKFTVVYISCSSLCEVRIDISIYQFMSVFHPEAFISSQTTHDGSGKTLGEAKRHTVRKTFRG